jgi:hypothetical protein
MNGASIPGRARNCSLLQSVRTGSGATQPPVHWVPGAASWVVKWLGCEFNYSGPCSAKVKNEWSCTSVLLICLQGMDMDNFTLFLYVY